MFWLDWLQAHGATRGKPAQNRRRSWSALGLLASVALLQSGCQSGPFSHCGDGTGLFSPCGFFGRVSSRVFNRSNPAGACCEPGVVAGTPVEYATPSAIVSPGASPSYPSGGASRSAIVVPGSTDSATDLSPVEGVPKVKVVPTPPGNGSTSRPGTQGASYQTRGSDSGARIARRRTENPVKTTVTTPEPTPRSAQAGVRSSSGGRTALDADPLDNIPPFDLPGDVPKSSSTPPVPPAAEPAAEPAKSPATKPDVKSETPAPPADELDLTSISLPVPEPAPAASVGPGLARFVAVDVKLAGGSLPSTAGLDWLVEKGYRTLLDLRESSEVSSAFIALVTSKGLRYIALPIGPGSIDRDHVARFQFEVAASEARPLYFFDTDGTRSGALWYIRRIANDRVDQQVARREAEELGLFDKAYWSAVTNYVSETPPTSGTSSPRSTSRSAPSSVPAAATTQPSEGSQPPVDAALAGNPFAWRSFTAVVITCVGLPLAYWSRNLAPANRARLQASLPAPAREPKSVRGELGA